MSKANKPHKVLAQAQKTIKRFGWTTGSWFVQNAGVCLEGAVGIRGHDQKTRTEPRLKACEYIQTAAQQVLEEEVASRHLNHLTPVPQLNDSIVGTEKRALEILELAEQLAYKDYLEEQFTLTLNEGEEDEEDVEIDIFFT